MKINKKIPKLKSARQPRTRMANEVLFILLIALGLTYLLALITHSPLENPYSSSNSIGSSALNQAGVIGAYLSDLSLSMLGFSAYLIPLAFGWLGWRIHKNSGKTPSHRGIFALRCGAFLILLFSATALLSIDAPSPIDGGGGIAGGDIGYFLHQYFSPLLGKAAFIIYLSIMMISFSISAVVSWISIFSSIANFLRVIWQKFSAYNSQAKAKRAEKRAVRKVAKNDKKIQQIKQISEPKPSFFAKKPSVKTNKIIQKPIAKSANLFTGDTLSGLPNLDLLAEISTETGGYSKQTLEDMSRQVELKLKDFGFVVSITTVTPGPVVTQFELSLAAGVKVSQIMNLNKDLARALLVESVRIVDVIPGKPVIGLEIPNEQRELIGLKEILSSTAFTKSESVLTMGLGKDINGNPVIANLTKMPHL
ncbi:MAG: hypothetical protein HAW59_06290 [Betaproteobacteria bacterium]|nr:hypothetical protein [Betaproteobacteria bacterium]